jgi:hypothetical protein
MWAAQNTLLGCVQHTDHQQMALPKAAMYVWINKFKLKTDKDSRCHESQMHRTQCQKSRILLHVSYLGVDLLSTGLLSALQLSKFLQNIWQQTKKSSSLQTTDSTQRFTQLNTARSWKSQGLSDLNATFQVFLSILLYFLSMVKKTCVTYSRTIQTRILKDFIIQQTYKGKSHENVRSMRKKERKEKKETPLCAALGTASTQNGLEAHPCMTDLTMWAMWCHDNTQWRLSTGSTLKGEINTVSVDLHSYVSETIQLWCLAITCLFLELSHILNENSQRWGGWYWRKTGEDCEVWVPLSIMCTWCTSFVT